MLLVNYSVHPFYPSSFDWQIDKQTWYWPVCYVPSQSYPWTLVSLWPVQAQSSSWHLMWQYQQRHLKTLWSASVPTTQRYTAVTSKKRLRSLNCFKWKCIWDLWMFQENTTASIATQKRTGFFESEVSDIRGEEERKMKLRGFFLEKWSNSEVLQLKRYRHILTYKTY